MARRGGSAATHAHQASGDTHVREYAADQELIEKETARTRQASRERKGQWPSIQAWARLNHRTFRYKGLK